MAKRKKSSSSTPARPRRAPVPQPHGGALIPGAGGGRQPGAGRPRDELREQFRDVLSSGGVDLVRSVIQGNTTIKLTGKCEHCGKESKGPTSLGDVLSILPTVENRLRAVDTAAKYGLGAMKEVSVENVRARMRETLAVIAKHVSIEQNAAIVAELKPVWA